MRNQFQTYSSPNYTGKQWRPSNNQKHFLKSETCGFVDVLPFFYIQQEQADLFYVQDFNRMDICRPFDILIEPR